jgi:hypothetical protein
MNHITATILILIGIAVLVLSVVAYVEIEQYLHEQDLRHQEELSRYIIEKYQYGWHWDDK